MMKSINACSIYMCLRHNTVGFALLAISFTVVFLAHRDAFRSHLRYGMVEDGSISQFAGELLSDAPLSVKYQSIIDTDGAQNGRYRPAYYVFETIPFFLTIVKNGDYEWGMSGSLMQSRINGDLRLHMIYLLCSIALSAGLMGILVYRYTGSFVCAAMVPVAVTASQPLITFLWSDFGEASSMKTSTCVIMGA